MSIISHYTQILRNSLLLYSEMLLVTFFLHIGGTGPDINLITKAAILYNAIIHEQRTERELLHISAPYALLMGCY